MPKTDKELAVDIAIAYIEAHTKQITAASNNVIKETSMIDLKSVNNIIKSIHTTLQELTEDKSLNQ